MRVLFWLPCAAYLCLDLWDRFGDWWLVFWLSFLLTLAVWHLDRIIGIEVITLFRSTVDLLTYTNANTCGMLSFACPHVR
jgi:hypothetical protein